MPDLRSDGPLISVVTPSFNQAAFIGDNIESVLAQNYPHTEHLIIDGGSTDGTIDILKRHRHLVWTSEPDRGQSDALNKGFRKAKGKIVGWLNSDDTYCPGAFDHVLDSFRDPAVMIVCGDGNEIDGKSSLLRTLAGGAVSPQELIRFWKWQYAFVQPSFFFRREVFTSVGSLDEDLHYTMDYDFLIRCGMRFQFVHLPVPLANLRLHEASKTGREVSSPVPAYIREMLKVSMRYWGGVADWRFYANGMSLLTALGGSLVKNLLFLPGSKARTALHPPTRGSEGS